ncbi:MAG: hypothetical protein HYX68_08700 [Planctomycetes bacterium]|nr:hypothetical protein [Planctomycetota bacterium]
MRMLLATGSLALMWFVCHTSSAQPKDAPPPDGFLPRKVTGYGETVDSAKKAAINKAVSEITSWLKLQSNVITEDYLRTKVLADEGQPGKDEKIDNIRDPFKAWVVTFRTDEAWWKDLAHRDHEAMRQQRASQREGWAMRGVLGLAVLLLTGVGYLRLDDYTRRRYTTWLRLAAAGVVTLVAAGWWWTI